MHAGRCFPEHLDPMFDAGTFYERGGMLTGFRDALEAVP